MMSYLIAVAPEDRSERSAGLQGDLAQAEVFLSMLGREQAEMSELLEGHRSALAHFEQVGDEVAVWHKQRVIRALENEVRAIEHMMNALRHKLAVHGRRPPS